MDSCLGILFLLAVNLLLCALVGKLAGKRGRSEMSWGVLSFVITPILGALLLFVMEDLSYKPRTSANPAPGNGEQMKKCQFCAEWIKHEATLCRYCQREQPTRQILARALWETDATLQAKPAPYSVLMLQAHELYGKGERDAALRQYVAIARLFPDCQEAWQCIKNSVGIEDGLRQEAATQIQRIESARGDSSSFP